MNIKYIHVFYWYYSYYDHPYYSTPNMTVPAMSAPIGLSDFATTPTPTMNTRDHFRCSMFESKLTTEEYRVRRKKNENQKM